MKTSLSRIHLLFLFLPIFLGVSSFRFQTPIVQQDITFTPTFDPLVETPLPLNPTELELGQNLYWHWCMTCHGDQGQGLTDEFREIWEEDHQNCWARGCHAGRPGDLGFPIPTFVPGVVTGDHLSHFASLQGFADYLKATHPPQNPGVLTDGEYHAIALFVFTMNGRAADTAVPTTLPVSTPTETPSPFPKSTETLILPTRSTADPDSTLINVIVIMAMLAVAGLVLARARIQKKIVSGQEV